MSVSNNNISKVIRILRAGTKRFAGPSVTMENRRRHDPFLVLIYCLLSLRTKDSTTIPASERLFALADTPEGLSSLSVKTIEKAIYPVGFYHTKARRIREICDDLIERFDGKVPDDLDVLLTFNGVGRKTANLVLTEGFGKPGVCVDTHVHRISNRFGYVSTKNPEQTEWALRKKLPGRYWIEYNALLVTWGQNVCKPVSPFCSRCGVSTFCLKHNVVKSR